MLHDHLKGMSDHNFIEGSVAKLAFMIESVSGVGTEHVR